MPADQDDPSAGRSARPPHPATVVQPKPAFGKPAARPPHPATVVQPKPAFAKPTARPPHPATVVQRKADAGDVLQRMQLGASSSAPASPVLVCTGILVV